MTDIVVWRQRADEWQRRYEEARAELEEAKEIGNRLIIEAAFKDAELERLKGAYTLATNRAQHYEAENERLRAKDFVPIEMTPCPLCKELRAAVERVTAQKYDLLLTMAEVIERIEHVQKIIGDPVPVTCNTQPGG